MKNEQRDIGQNDLAEIWQSAQQRRTEDVGRWLANYLERWQKPRKIEAGPQFSPQGQAAFRNSR